MPQAELNRYPHRRKNILTGECILVSPHRTNRPWQGETSLNETASRPEYDPDCYLCPGNKRANGEINPVYDSVFAFTNDFSSLLEDIPAGKINRENLLIAKSESGICRVLNFSPRHDLTLAEMEESDVIKVVEAWRAEYKSIGSRPKINHVQIFENKGAMMGNSAPHPHCQIWEQESIPVEPAMELKEFRKHFLKTGKSLLADYWKREKKEKERVVYEYVSFIIVAPF